MELNDEQLAMLEKLGNTFYSINDAAIVLEVSRYDLKALLTDESTEAYKRYHKGVFLREMEVRESLLQTAARGSGPAQKQAIELLERMKLDNI